MLLQEHIFDSFAFLMIMAGGDLYNIFAALTDLEVELGFWQYQAPCNQS